MNYRTMIPIILLPLATLIVAPQAAAAGAGQFVRTESGRTRCAVGGNDPYGGGPVVVCKAGGLPADASPDLLGFPEAPTDPPANCPLPQGHTCAVWGLSTGIWL
jgi:hypothetical protein